MIDHEDELGNEQAVPLDQLSDEEIDKLLDGKLGTHMLSGLWQELVDVHRNHRSENGYTNLRKLLRALQQDLQPVAPAVPDVWLTNNVQLHSAAMVGLDELYPLTITKVIPSGKALGVMLKIEIPPDKVQQFSDLLEKLP